MERFGGGFSKFFLDGATAKSGEMMLHFDEHIFSVGRNHQLGWKDLGIRLPQKRIAEIYLGQENNFWIDQWYPIAS